MFYRWCFFFWHFAVLYLRAASADWLEILRHDRNRVQSDNLCLKMWGDSPKKLWTIAFLHLAAKSLRSLDRSPWSEIGAASKVRCKNLGVSPKHAGRKKIQKLAHNLAWVNNFGTSGSNLTKLVHVTWHKTGMKNWVQTFRGPAHSKFSLIGAISYNFGLRSRISPERIEISKSGVINYNSSNVRRKFGELWSTNKWVHAANWIITHPKSTFSKDHILARGAAPSNSYTCYRMTKAR